MFQVNLGTQFFFIPITVPRIWLNILLWKCDEICISSKNNLHKEEGPYMPLVSFITGSILGNPKATCCVAVTWRIFWSCSYRCLGVAWHGYWEPNSGPLEEQEVLLTPWSYKVIRREYLIFSWGHSRHETLHTCFFKLDHRNWKVKTYTEQL